MFSRSRNGCSRNFLHFIVSTPRRKLDYPTHTPSGVSFSPPHSTFPIPYLLTCAPPEFKFQLSGFKFFKSPTPCLPYPINTLAVMR